MLTKLLLLACVYAVLSNPLGLEHKWKEFKLTHKKVYRLPGEETYRFQVFRENLKTIEQHNKKYEAGLVSWGMGVNQFADMTAEEFQEFLDKSGPAPPLDTANLTVYKAPLGESLPTSVDYRRGNSLSPIRNQGSVCGSCYAHASTAAVESHYHYHKNSQVKVVLSPQNIIDCSSVTGNGGCGGGRAFMAFNYMKQYGIMEEKDYPYHEATETCKFDPNKSLLKIKGHTSVNTEIDDIKSALANKGIVTARVDAKEWHLYTVGIFEPKQPFRHVSHAVNIVGYYDYGAPGLDPAWVVRNSWGTNWGEQGYIRVKQNLTHPYTIGIQTEILYPNL